MAAPQVPMVPPQLPGGQLPMVPPVSAGVAGNGSQFQLPPAGPFAAVQGAPLPQDLDGPAAQVRPVADESPLTGVRGLPAVGAAVGTLLGLLWLQRRIQRRRRSRHIL